jgi:MFS superfamily sulfate permease-like transporter
MSSEYTVHVEENKKEKKVFITLKGNLNIANINGIHDEFRNAVKGKKKVNIHTTEVDDIDLTMIQYLKVFELSAEKEKVEVKIDFNLNDDNSTLLEKAGLLNLFKTH